MKSNKKLNFKLTKGNLFNKVKELYNLLCKNNSVEMNEIVDVELFKSEHYLTQGCLDSLEGSIDKELPRISSSFRRLLKLSRDNLKIKRMYKDEDEILEFATYFINSLETNKLNIKIARSQVGYYVATNIMLLIYNCSGCINIKIDNVSEIETNFGKSKTWTAFYRGQSDSSRNLIATIYRKLPISGVREVIDYKFVRQKYVEFGFIDRYRKVKGCNVIKEIDYDFLAYMQHSSSYSPLLDFTNDYKIALIFATSPKDINPNVYAITDAALFVLMIPNDDLKRIDAKNIKSFRDMNIEFVKDRYNHLSVKNGKKLYLCGEKDFEIVYQIETDKTNDRMINQKGSFFFLKKGTIVNNHMLIPLKQLNLFKIIIPADKSSSISKWKMHQQFSKQKHLSIESLMDPYLYISDYTSK